MSSMNIESGVPTLPRGITLGGLSSGKPRSSFQGIEDEMTERGTLSGPSELSVEHNWNGITHEIAN